MQTILFAGMESASIKSLMSDLRSDKFTVHQVIEVEELLLKCTTNNKIDLMMLDINFSGHESARLVKQLRSLCCTKTCIVLVGEYTFMAMSLAVYAGFDEFISRPIGKEAVMALLNGCNECT
jgi:CheY-like chemotaxis protein